MPIYVVRKLFLCVLGTYMALITRVYEHHTIFNVFIPASPCEVGKCFYPHFTDSLSVSQFPKGLILSL